MSSSKPKSLAFRLSFALTNWWAFLSDKLLELQNSLPGCLSQSLGLHLDREWCRQLLSTAANRVIEFMFRTQLLDKGSTDFEIFDSFGKGDSGALFSVL